MIIGYHVVDERDCGGRGPATTDCGPELRLYRTREAALSRAREVLAEVVADSWPTVPSGTQKPAGTQLEYRVRDRVVEDSPHGVVARVMWDYRAIRVSQATSTVEVAGKTYQRQDQVSTVVQDWAPLVERRWHLLGEVEHAVVSEHHVCVDAVTVEYIDEKAGA